MSHLGTGTEDTPKSMFILDLALQVSLGWDKSLAIEASGFSVGLRQI